MCRFILIDCSVAFKSYHILHCINVVHTCTNVNIILCCAGNSVNSDTGADTDNVTENPPQGVGRRLYVCTVCEERFTTKGNLNVHKLLHNGGTLYPCTQLSLIHISEPTRPY